MKIWYREIRSWSQPMIQHSVNDAAWQRFRISLKGLSTENKLDNLEGYCQRREKDGNRMSMEDQCRIDNYINALLRGGQLKRGKANIVAVQR